MEEETGEVDARLDARQTYLLEGQALALAALDDLQMGDAWADA